MKRQCKRQSNTVGFADAPRLRVSCTYRCRPILGKYIPSSIKTRVRAHFAPNDVFRLVTPSTMKRRGEATDDHPQKHPRCDVCNWCATRPRMDGKPYCQVYAARGRECGGCHRPMPTEYFDGDANVCKTCISKYDRQQTIRKK